MKYFKHPSIVEFICNFIYDNLIEYEIVDFDAINENGKIKLVEKYNVNLEANESPENYKFDKNFYVRHLILKVLDNKNDSLEKKIFNEMLEILGWSVEDFNNSMTNFIESTNLLEINMMPCEKKIIYIKFDFS